MRGGGSGCCRGHPGRHRHRNPRSPRPRERGGLRRPPPPRLREPPRPGDALRGRRVPGRHPQQLESRRLRGVGGRDGTRDPDLRLRHHRHWHRRCRDHRRNPPGRHCQHRGRGRARALQHGRTALWPGPSGVLGGDSLGNGDRTRRRRSPRRGRGFAAAGHHPSRCLRHRRRGQGRRPAGRPRLRRRGTRPGTLLGALVNIFGPDAIAVGGGVGSQVDLLEAPVRAAMAEIAFDAPLRRCRVGQAELGSDAGLVGAVAWAGRIFLRD